MKKSQAPATATASKTQSSALPPKGGKGKVRVDLPKEPFHTWSLDDDQSSVLSAASLDLRKEEKDGKETAAEQQWSTNVKGFQLQGLPTAADYSSESDDEHDKNKKNKKKKQSSASSSKKEEQQDSGKTDSDREGEAKIDALQKTLQPMASEEEILEKEQIFRDLLHKAKTTLKATVFSFADRLQPSPSSSFAPLPPSPQPARVSRAQQERMAKLTQALDNITTTKDEEEQVLQEEQEVASKSAKQLSQRREDLARTGSPAKASRMKLAEEGDLTSEAAPTIATGSKTAGRTRIKAPQPNASASLPTLPTEQITDQVTFLDVKVTKAKTRAFDWAVPLAQSEQQQANSSSSSNREEGKESSQVETSHSLPPDSPEPLREAVGVTAKVDTPLYFEIKPGGIGYDRRVLAGETADELPPKTPLTARSTEDSFAFATKQQPRPARASSAHAARALAPASATSRATNTLKSFVVPKSSQQAHSSGNPAAPSPTASPSSQQALEDEVFRISSATVMQRSVSQQQLAKQSKQMRKEVSLSSLG
eukprot:gene7218-7984_t